MKKYNQIVEAYNYSELSEEAKEVAKEKYISTCRDPYMFTEDLIEDLRATYGLFNLKTHYSLGYCQGDGLCLYGKIDDSEIFSNKLFKKIALKGLVGKQISSAEDAIAGVAFNHSGRYYYAKSTDIESIDNHYNMTEKQQIIVDKVIENITNWYLEFCSEWKNIGYDFFYEVDEETMIDMSQANQWVYDENGNITDVTGLEEVA